MAPPQPALALAHQLKAARPALLRFALHQLSNKSLAEDAVQETLLAFLEQPQRFEGRSALLTYLSGILRHKVFDAANTARRFESAVDTDEDLHQALQQGIEAGWYSPGHARTPEQCLEHKQLMRLVDSSVQRLPAQCASVFLMRDVQDLDSALVCQRAGVTRNNLGVILFRARRQLRGMLLPPFEP